MLTDEFILGMILKYVPEMGITAYELSKNTSISDQAAHKILSGKTVKPRRKNLLEILRYLESKMPGILDENDSNYNPIFAAKQKEVREEPAPYDTRDNSIKFTEQLEKTIKLYGYISYLENVLTDKNIKFEKKNYFDF